MKIKRICHYCVGEEFLSKLILRLGEKRMCSYCNESGKSFTIEQLSKKIEKAFEDHYIRSSTEPDNWEYLRLKHEAGYIWERQGESVEDMIMDMAEISEEAAKDTHEVLAAEHYDHSHAEMGMESEFDADTFYLRKEVDDAYWRSEWNKFEISLKTEARFFNKIAADHLNAVFDQIETMRSSDGRPLVTSIGPGKEISALFRARVFQSDKKLEEALTNPVEQLGTPSSVYASGGRMNAWGIPVFYGALNPETAIAEVRPPVGSKVSVARFGLTRELLLLDLTALNEVLITGSIFDETYLGRLERAMFLRSLSRRITKAVMPDDVLVDYLVTQAIADYLSVGSKFPLDGIIYPSAQVEAPSSNIVLFNKSARVETLPDPGKLHANLGYWTEDGWDIDYSIKEEKAKSDEDTHSFKDFDDEILAEVAIENTDTRHPTLKIDLDSIVIHAVNAVSYSTVPFEVRHWSV